MRTRISLAAARWLAPPFVAFVFVVHPLLALLRSGAELTDPGTGGHLATGRYILATHAIPHLDPFSFTAAGQPWIVHSWLFAVVGALLERAGGLPLFATACVLLFAFVPVLLYRRMLSMGASVLPALLLTLVAYLVLSLHAFARPHVVTYLLFASFVWRLDDVYERRRPARALWVLPPLAAVWCNVHGGFISGVVLVAIFTAAASLRALGSRGAGARREAAPFALVLVAVVLATALNPNGFGLHWDVLRHLATDVTTPLLEEWQSPSFQPISVQMFCFELLVLSVIVAAAHAGLAWLELVLVGYFLHEALHAVRNVTFFAIIAAPIVARELSLVVEARWPAFAARWRGIARQQAALRAPLLYLPVLSSVFVLLAVSGRTAYPSTLDDLQLTRGASAYIAAHKTRFAHAFNTDNLGGSLIYRFWPDVRVFMDDRIYVYGDAFVAGDYLPVLAARPGWQEALDRHHVDAAIVTVTAPCAALFREAPGWELAFEDERNAIFLRRPS